MIDWQVLSIPLYGGVDTKTDEALVETSKVLELENGVFSVKDRRNKRTAITKRNGYLQRSGPSTYQALATSGNQLLAFDKFESWSYSEKRSNFISTGFLEVLKVKQTDLFRPAAFADGQDTILVDNVRADVCTTGPSASIRLTDNLTGTVIQETFLSLIETNFKLIPVGNYIHLYSVSGSANLILRVFNIADGQIITTVTITGALSSKFYDVSSDNEKAIVAWAETGGINVSYYTKLGVQGSSVINGLPAPIVAVPGVTPSWISIRYFENVPINDLIYICFCNAQLTIEAAGLNENFTSAFPLTTLYTGVTNEEPTRAVTITRESANVIGVFFDVGATGQDPDTVCFLSTDTLASVITAKTRIAPGSIIAAKSFTVNNCAHVPVLKFSANDVQNTLMIIFMPAGSSSPVPCAKINYGEAGALTAYTFQNDGTDALTVLPESQVIGTKAFLSSLVVTSLGENENNQFKTSTGTQLIELDADSKDSYLHAPLGKTLHMGGGFLSSYDGTSWAESGFHFYPEIVSTSVASGGSIAAGLYLYYAVYYWMNNKGEIERSAPSIPQSVTVANPSSSVDVEVTNYSITQKEIANGLVKIELYRSLVNPPANAPAYLVTSINNNRANLTSTITDTEADSTLQNNEILYTTGGVLENIPPNGGNIVESYKNRIVLNDPKDSNLTWISKEYVAGQTVNFNPFLTFRSNDLGGPITGYKQLDDKLLIFKKNLIFFTSGQGPNNTGTDFGLFPPELVASDTGCDNQSSIVLTPVGVMFKSAKGFYIINRSLQLEYIGYDVEIFNFQNVTSALMVEDRNQVRFLTDSGLTLVYDYLYKQWSTFTNHEGADAAMWKNVYTYLRMDGAVWSENEGSYLDHATSIRMRIKTPWIKLTQGAQGKAAALGPQSFFRVRRFAILGRYASKHILQVSVGYDYRPDYQAVYYFDTQTRLTGPAGQYGNDSYYGETTPYGGSGGADEVYQFRARTVRQKCESIQFLIEDISQPTNGESYGITDLSLEVGLKRGINKMGALKTVPAR